MASTAFTNVFLSSPRLDAGIPDFDSLQIVPSDFWRRHFLVHDGSFRKLGNCDFHRGVWYFTPIGCGTSFMGFSRDDATKAWLTIPLCASPLPAYTAQSPGTAARPFRGFPIYFPEFRLWPRYCACWQRSFSWS